MQQDITDRSSFFDDEDLRIKFNFKKPEKKDESQLHLPPTIKDFLHRTGPNEPSPNIGFYAIHGNILAYYKGDSSKTPDACLHLPHSRMKVVDKATGTANPGFQLCKNGTTYEFSCKDNTIVENWIKVLKNHCVLTTFHDEYKAQKMIGRGSFAKVYLVESKSEGGTYAVKAFTKESLVISNKSNAKPAMINEIDIMRACNHENIIKLYEVYETEKSIYLVLELIQGKSLQEVLKKQNFSSEYSESRIQYLMKQLLDALAYLAAKGIMHRDLKPDNILVDKGDKLKIVDFGLATFIDIPEYIFKKCGTPGYIAPEVFKFDQKNPATAYDDRCDAFSAGAILFYMLMGEPFFDGTNASEILKMNRKFTAEFESLAVLQKEIKNKNSKINAQGLDLCIQLCEWDQKKRARCASAVNHQYLSSIKNFGGSYSPEKKIDVQDEINRQLGKTGDKSTHSGGKQDRFAEKDSLYLDLGKPELQGKVDTLTSGSHNNSLLLNHGLKNTQQETKEGSLSGFAANKKNLLLESKKKGQSSSFKNPTSQLHKVAIFKNMQNNNPEESKDDTASPSKGTSGFSPSKYGRASTGEEDETSENVSAGKLNSGFSNSSKLAGNSPKRF